MSDSYIPDNIQNLIDRLLNVNSITGIESIIDMCREAACYISIMESYKNEIVHNTEGVNWRLNKNIK